MQSTDFSCGEKPERADGDFHCALYMLENVNGKAGCASRSPPGE